MNTATANTILGEAKAIDGWIVDIRRRLHQCPELLYELHATSKVVTEVLDELQIPYQAGIAETGILATIGNGDSPCVMLRADMDALPIEEEADVDFKSKHPGKMHACGHDCHTAMLLGAARLLKQQESQLKGTVKFCFQPAEEGGAGAKKMCDEGIMENPAVDKSFGIHVWPHIPTGQLTGRPGPFLAAASAFRMVVRGKGGHAAMPHYAIDPVTTAASIITQVQTIISREQDPLEAGVEIIATPPGKPEFNNSLLSGGEKALTAVSLLMAIFQFRPSPFCVLDEVDAPFDEANIGRFIDVMKSFLGWTKFVIVTHSKKTMTSATTLYGVTMQESGVSKRVSVRFEDVSEDGEISADAINRDDSDDERGVA